MNSESIDVNALPVQPVITQNSNQLIASTAKSYQWFYNNLQLNGVVQQKLTITQNGFYYACIRDMNACESCSAPFNAVINAMETIVANDDLQVFPNPAQKEICISGFFSTENGKIKFMNAIGQCVKIVDFNGLIVGKKMLIDVNDLQTGLYSIVFQTGQLIRVKKIIIAE